MLIVFQFIKCSFITVYYYYNVTFQFWFFVTTIRAYIVFSVIKIKKHIYIFCMHSKEYFVFVLENYSGTIILFCLQFSTLLLDNWFSYFINVRLLIKNKSLIVEPNTQLFWCVQITPVKFHPVRLRCVHHVTFI